MNSNLPESLALVNDVLQAVIVIFGTAVVLYNLGRSLRAPVIRAFSTLIAFFIIVYLTELLVSRTILPLSTEVWLKLKWIGITLVPAAQYYLSDTLLTTTGASANRRKLFLPASFVAGFVFLALVLWTDLLIDGMVRVDYAPHLRAGPFFLFFVTYFWVVTAASIYNVWRARQRCITSTARQRMTITLVAFLAAPLGVFPYLSVSESSVASDSLLFWIAVIAGNLVVGTMFALLTAHLIYFGTVSPDRVVRVRLYKFMARVPMAASIVLLVYVLVSRSAPILGLPTETALGFALVTTVMLVEWFIHAYKRPLERMFQLDDEPDIRRIQQLSERLLTTKNLQQFLESVLAATCEALRTPTAFVAAITAEGPKLEAVVGPLAEPEDILRNADWQRLTQPGGNGAVAEDLETADDFILWQDYWIRPLYNRQQTAILGIMGVRARSDLPDLAEEDQEVMTKLMDQAASALEDRILQQGVFAAVEGLLPEITAFQQRLSAVTFGGLPVLTSTVEEEALVDHPEFKGMVRDALSHYWGGPKLTRSPLMHLRVVQRALAEHENNAANALRAILAQAIELQKPEGQRSMTTAEWILYNILELKFLRGQRVRDVARRLAMSESDLYRKQRVAIENVARAIANMEVAAVGDQDLPALESELPR
jgi:hypothetical protein